MSHSSLSSSHGVSQPATRTSSTPALRPPRKTPKVTHRVVEPNAGGADLGATQIYACVPADRTDQPVRCFDTFTADLYALAAWFKEHGVTSVALESTGSFWIPVLHILETCGLEVLTVNAQHVKNLPGRRTHVQGCHCPVRKPDVQD